MASATLAVCFLAVWYVFLWPTSDVRTRMYILLYMTPGPAVPFLILWAFFTALGSCVVLTSGWRGVWPLLGSVVGASFGVAVLWSGILGLYVWRYDEQVTVLGQAVRATLAASLAGVIVVWTRRAARTGVAA
jgi:hypothetical protein